MIKEFEKFKKSGYGLEIWSGDKIIFNSKKSGLQGLLEFIKKNRKPVKNLIIFDKKVGNAVALLCAWLEVGLQGLGNRGLVEVISFSFTKVVQGMQGGAILTNDDKIAEKCKTMVKRYGKMTELNAYLVSKSMNSVVMNQEKRFGIIDKYKELLKINYSTQVVPRETNDSVFAILLESQEIRDKIFDVLAKNNIESKIYYQPVVEETDYFRRTLPNKFDIYSRILSLPVYPKMENEVEQICKVINEAL